MSPSAAPPRVHSLFRFVAATLISLAVSFGVTIALHELLGASEELAYAAALFLVYLLNFAFLRWWIYGLRLGPIVPQFLFYSASAVGFRAAEYGVFLVLHTWLGMQYLLAMALVQGASFLTKFFYYGSVVFRRRHAELEA